MGALIVGSFTHLSASIARGLWQEKIRVFSADSVRLTRGSFSRCVVEHFTYTSPALSEEKFIQDLISIIGKTGARVLLPGSADMYYMIARKLDVLSGSIAVPIPTSEQIEMIRGKDRLLEICKELGILTPSTIYFARIENIIEQKESLEYPLLLKPSDSHGGKGIHLVKDKRELRSKLLLYRKETRLSDCLVQRYIEGQKLGVACIYDRGVPVCSMAYRQIHNLPHFGAPTLTVTCAEARAENILKGVLDHYHWHGVCQADLIAEENTGKIFLHDINPRLPVSLFLTVAMGINFPYILYKMAVKEEIVIPAAPRKRTKVLWLEGELSRRLALLRKKGHWKEAFDLRELKDVDCVADFACGDYKPTLFYPIWVISKYYQQKFRGAM